MIYTKREILEMLFWDIETQPAYDSFEKVPKAMQDIWLEKYHAKYCEKYIENKQKEEFNRSSLANEKIYTKHTDVSIKEYPSINDIYINSAALHAEFAKITCISLGFFTEDDENKMERTVFTFKDKDEKQILLDFKTFLDSPETAILKLTGYNIREFDIPFTTKRFFINHITLPKFFDLKGKKPWEIIINDICDDWKGLQREIVSLHLVCTVLGINTPKDKFKNSEVSALYLSGKITLDEVVEYCEKDINACMSVVEFLTK